MDSFAPVLIPTLNRYDHFQRCIGSLAKCVHSEKTDVYIALDFPSKESQWEGYEKIEKLLDSVTGFNSLNIIKRESNYGELKNFIEARKVVFDRHDILIFSEDDNEFAPNFLDYINKGLDKFKADPQVAAICGYTYPITIPRNYAYNYYYYQTFSAWGFGMWKNKQKAFSYNPAELSAFMKKNSFARKLYSIAAQKPLSVLESIKNNLPLYGDGVVSLENIKSGTYCIFPAVSKVKNYGHDGTGLHCSKVEESIFLNQALDTDLYFDYDKNVPVINTVITKPLKEYFELSLKGKIKMLLFYSLLKLNLLNKHNGLKDEKRVTDI